jgi:hypothetical protein
MDGEEGVWERGSPSFVSVMMGVVPITGFTSRPGRGAPFTRESRVSAMAVGFAILVSVVVVVVANPSARLPRQLD